VVLGSIPSSTGKKAGGSKLVHCVCRFSSSSWFYMIVTNVVMEVKTEVTRIRTKRFCGCVGIVDFTARGSNTTPKSFVMYNYVNLLPLPFHEFPRKFCQELQNIQ
jgi:hypothetical protein